MDLKWWAAEGARRVRRPDGTVGYVLLAYLAGGIAGLVAILYLVM